MCPPRQLHDVQQMADVCVRLLPHHVHRPSTCCTSIPLHPVERLVRRRDHRPLHGSAQWCMCGVLVQRACAWERNCMCASCQRQRGVLGLEVAQKAVAISTISAQSRRSRRSRSNLVWEGLGSKTSETRRKAVKWEGRIPMNCVE